MAKTKWKPYHLRDGSTEDQLTSNGSVPTRTASNPVSSRPPSAAPSYRSISDSHSSRVTLLDRPRTAAELQRLHESRESSAANSRSNSQSHKLPGANSASTTKPAFLSNSQSSKSSGSGVPSTTNSTTQSVEASKSPHRNQTLSDTKRGLPLVHQRSDSKNPDQYLKPLSESVNLGSYGLYPRGDDMATAPTRMSGRPSRIENRPPMSSTLCRNGPQCRKFQEGTCHYNHDFGSMQPNGINASVYAVTEHLKDVVLSNDSSKRSLNVESPAFTPKPQNATLSQAKLGLSPKAATAANFTPRGSGSVTPATNSHSKEPSGEFIPQHFQPAQQFNEFVPGQSFITPPQVESQQPQMTQQLNAYENPFLAQSSLATLDATQTQINPYAQQTPNVGNQAFFQDASGFKHPLNYHLYASVGPKRENLMTYQRNTTDFFIPDDFREELHRKSEATWQTFANSTLPQNVEYFHSLVVLDTNSAKGPSTFGYSSWIYKAQSSRDGRHYALRRIEGFRLNSEAAIRTINSWKRISNSNLVRVYDAFTGRWFGDSSLIVVTDYHPRSQTLAEKHFPVGRHPHRTGGAVIPENDLWGYIVQLANALKAIHEGGVAAQSVTASKVLLTSKNRVRLSGCGVLDIVQYEQRRPIHELQRADLQDLGRLILGLAARNPTAYQNTHKALELISRTYTERLRSCIAWLVEPPPVQDASQPTSAPMPATEYNVHNLLNSIADKVISTLDSAQHLEDHAVSNLMGELENGRLVRLLAKLNIILERPDTSSTPNASTTPATLNLPSAAWSETGERYYLKLFRDYVFHQVDQDGRPVTDLGHIITCLNKLDAGIDEKIQLVSRDEQSMFITSYKEVKRGFAAAWSEIMNPQTSSNQRAR